MHIRIALAHVHPCTKFGVPRSKGVRAHVHPCTKFGVPRSKGVRAFLGSLLCSKQFDRGIPWPVNQCGRGDPGGHLGNGWVYWVYDWRPFSQSPRREWWVILQHRYYRQRYRYLIGNALSWTKLRFAERCEPKRCFRPKSKPESESV